MADTPVRVGLAGDDHAHRILMQTLADTQTPSPPGCAPRRRWVGDGAGSRLLRLSDLGDRGEAPSGRPVYRSQRTARGPLGYAAVLVQAARTLAPRVDVSLILADEDGDATRMSAPAEASAFLAANGGRPAVFGVCNPIAEAWMVAMVGPSRPKRLAQLSAALGFAVARTPERLTANPKDHPRHAKRALNFLLDDRSDQIEDYRADTPKSKDTEAVIGAASITEELTTHLQACGLAPFVASLRRIYAPMVA